MGDFIISAATLDHEKIENALAQAKNGRASPAALPLLFECLGLALGDAHLNDKYAASIITGINEICRNCSNNAARARAALAALRNVFVRGSTDIKAYAVDAACLLKTRQALRFVLKAAEDQRVLSRCDIEEHIDEMVGLIYSANPLSGLRELGKMLSHPSWDIRRYAANRLLLFGEPGQPGCLADEAHALLAKGAREGCREARILLRYGHELGENVREWPRSFREERIARAARAFYERVKRGGNCEVPEGLWRRVRPEAVGGCLQCPPRKFAEGPKRPELRLISPGNPAGTRR